MGVVGETKGDNAYSDYEEDATVSPENCDVIHFEVFNPVEAKEEWAISFPTDYKSVRIVINGEDFCDIANKIDCERFLKENPCCGNTNEPMYGHGELRWIYDGLIEAFTEGSYAHDCGLELLCCWECGDAGCWSVVAHFRQDENYVYWENFEHNHRDWEYDFSFRFSKVDYYKELATLKEYLEGSSAQ